jgi:tRNA-specific 2-thiouridylase
MKRVFVGLSGGVDSSVSALLLKNAGYDVTGVFIRGWQPDWIPCTWKADRISAMRTAAHLEIPFITLDLEQQYKDKVVTYLLEVYKNGRTPNPDMLCNREIKFGDFLRWSVRQGADYVATGHYAVADGQTSVELSESADKEKDQSYFLSQLTQNELSKILFPIGHLQKSEVRKIASENNLPVATRKDSQGICFVGDLEMSEFLKKELTPVPGKVLLHSPGGVYEEVGTHDGAILYTIGQRHGFTISNNSTTRNTFYVVDKNLNNNTITVSEKSPIETFHNETNDKQEIIINSFSFTNSLDDIKNAKNLSMRIRYRGEKYEIKFSEFNEAKKELLVESKDNLHFAHGQFAVLYDGVKCLGGGEL